MKIQYDVRREFGRMSCKKGLLNLDGIEYLLVLNLKEVEDAFSCCNIRKLRIFVVKSWQIYVRLIWRHILHTCLRLD